MKNKSVGLNAILNVIKTLCSIAFPLITFPYVTRVLGAENLGKVNYANSIIQYFILIAVLGSVTYATRECAAIRENKLRLEQTAGEIIGLNIITTVFSYILFLSLLLFNKSLEPYKLLLILYSTEIVFKVCSFDWINSVFEDFTYITIRTFILQLISLFCIFYFVKQTDDYNKYVVIQAIVTGIICLTNYIYLKRYINIKPKFQFNRTIFHLKNSLIFFTNSFAITVYCNSAITILGILKGDWTVGIFAVSAKIYTILKNLIASVFVVCIPRLSYYFNSDEKKCFCSLLQDISGILILLALPIAFGLGILAPEIIIIVSGKDYIAGAGTLSILSIGIVFSILGGIVNNCILIPIKKEKISLISTIFAALTNLVLNLILIPFIGIIGAAVAAIFAEIVAFLFSYILSKEVRLYFSFYSLIKYFIHAIIGGVTVAVIVTLVRSFFSEQISIVLFSIIFSVIVYLVELILFKNKFVIKLLHDYWSLKNKER